MKPFLLHNFITGLLICFAALLSGGVPSLGQTGGASGGELQQKIAAVKQSVAENQQKLHQYQWTETTQLTLKGSAKLPKESMCIRNFGRRPDRELTRK